MRPRILVRAAAGLALAAFGFAALVIVGQAASFYEPGSKGYDLSFPQCGSRLPKDGDFAIVGVNHGLPWSANPCVKAQYQWASSLETPASFYTNTANPGPPSQYWDRPGPGSCDDPESYEDIGCAYNYGWNAAAQSFSVAVGASSTTAAREAFWWLDVETMNSWEGSSEANAATVEGYIDYFRSQGVANVGIYSTAVQWSLITASHELPDVPNWVAGASSERTAQLNCRSSFTGGDVLLSQYTRKGYGKNLACDTASLPRSHRFD